MLETSSASRSTPASSPEAPLAQRRVDPAHPANRPETVEPVRRSADESAGEPPTWLSPKLDAQQLEHHAEQLAELLRLKQRDLDRRESQLHAQLGQAEQRERAARLQFEDRRLALEEREIQLARREAELIRRTTALAAAEAAEEQAAQTARQLSDRLAAELDLREQRLAEREGHLQERERQLVSSQQQLQVSQQKWQQQITCEHQQLMARQAEALSQRRLLLANLEQQHEAAEQSALRAQRTLPQTAEISELESAPAPQLPQAKNPPSTTPDKGPPLPSVNELQHSLKQQLSDLNRRSRALEQERELWLAQRSAEEREFRERSAASDVRFEQREKRLQQQRMALERLRDLLASARQDALRIHGQTLEMRLAIEVVWANLSALTTPADISQTVAQVRSELEQHYAVQRHEIEQLLAKTKLAAQQLQQRHQRLETDRQEWRAWIEAQRKSLEQRAAQLDALQQRVDARQMQLRRLDYGPGKWAPGQLCRGPKNPNSPDNNIRAALDQTKNR